ncbi:MAG: PadR family transcriptional regulator [Thermodesulfobacteriota bacterium]
MNSQNTKEQAHSKRVNAADYPILGVLTLGPAHGYDVWRYIRDHLGGVWQLGRSQVYALLAQLERDALVYHERVEQTNLPSRKVYYLKDEGRVAFDTWIRQPVQHVRDCRLEFPSKLHFARKRSAGAASSLILDQMAVCLRKRRQMEAARDRCTVEIQRQVLDYRLAVIDATIGWLKGLVVSENAESPLSGDESSASSPSS